MKTYLVISYIIIILFLCGFGGCKKDPEPLKPPQVVCEPEEEHVYFSGNVFAPGATLPHSTHKFDQTITSFKGQGCTKPSTYSTKLEIVNNTTQRISYSYTINVRINAVTWSYQGSVNRLAPGATSDVGVISTRVGSIAFANPITVTTSQVIFE